EAGSQVSHEHGPARAREAAEPEPFPPTRETVAELDRGRRPRERVDHWAELHYGCRRQRLASAASPRASRSPARRSGPRRSPWAAELNTASPASARATTRASRQSRRTCAAE